MRHLLRVYYYELCCLHYVIQVVYEDLSMVKLASPYAPGFLAFREAGFLVEKIEKLRHEKPEVLPQAVLVDGNGILHTQSVKKNYFLVYCML